MLRTEEEIRERMELYEHNLDIINGNSFYSGIYSTLRWVLNEED